ncbi:MAG: glutamate 5-kinase [Actinomycetota bacterium]
MTTKTVVVKVGTSSVTTADGAIDSAALAAVATGVADLHTRGWRVVLVTSGAITAGWSAAGGGLSRPSDLRTLQAVAAVGQPLLMAAWAEAFSASATTVGQVLLAPLDFAHRGQYLRARGTVEALFELGVVPIVNENDAVANEEIRFGDNDRIAALVANLVGAERLVLLTDTLGLLTADPHLDSSATLIEEVRAIDTELESLAGSSSSVVGSGGMASKLAAARIATWAGVSVVIAPSRADNAVVRSVERSERTFGTLFHERSEKMGARKAWIAFALPTRGQLRINAGAARALINEGRSLLRVGVDHVDGTFDSGDAVEVVDGHARLVAKGLVRTAAANWLDGEEVVIHRDDLVVLLRS